jgi:hypothetical protein
MNNPISRIGNDRDPVVSFEMEEIEQRADAHLSSACGGCTGCGECCPKAGCWVFAS